MQYFVHFSFLAEKVNRDGTPEEKIFLTLFMCSMFALIVVAIYLSCRYYNHVPIGPSYNKVVSIRMLTFEEISTLSYGVEEANSTIKTISFNLRLAFILFYSFLFFLTICNCCIIVFFSIKACIVKIEPIEEEKKYFVV